MKLIELKEAALSAKNFPGEINAEFPGAGERTNYVASQTDGYPLLKDVNVVNPSPGYENLQKGTRVFVTNPGKLYRGSQIGATPSSGVFASVGVKSADPNNAIGMIPISAIEKPAGKKQSRVSAGSSAQDRIFEIIRDAYGEENVEYVSSAPVGSTKPDLVVKVNQTPAQFEIKGTSSVSSPITFFDKSVRRGMSVEILNDLTRAFTGIPTFEKMIDQFRKRDKSIGYVGDEGVGKSGKLPSELTSTDDDILQAVRNKIIEHLHEGGDNYFVVYDRSANEPHIFFTGLGKNVLKAKPIPKFKKASLQTYGGPSGGAMRVGFKIRL